MNAGSLEVQGPAHAGLRVQGCGVGEATSGLQLGRGAPRAQSFLISNSLGHSWRMQARCEREGWRVPMSRAMREYLAARGARGSERGGGGSEGQGAPWAWPDLPPELVALVFAGLRPRDLRRGALRAPPVLHPHLGLAGLPNSLLASLR